VTFIHDFKSWHADLSALAPLLRSTPDAALRSGLCAALGSLEPESLTEEERESLEAVLGELYARAPDAGTHSAAGWALRRWNVTMPALPVSAAPPGRQWFVTPHGLTMLAVPTGKFRMGDASIFETPHEVTIRRRFCLSDREIGVELFLRFLADPDCPAGDKPQRWPGYSKIVSPTVDCPIQNVSWRDALLFCNWLSRREGRRPCYRQVGQKETDWECDFEADGYRLPTDAEWEYACRAGSTTRYPIGDEPDLVLTYGNLELTRCLPGGSRLPNPWGFFDLLGNVWEWCWDGRTTLTDKPAQDPGNSRDAHPERLGRGGAFGAGSFYCRSARRLFFAAGTRQDSQGFRVACTVPGPGER
jgi:formylglycine-generating enzyme required for sulfatase activity